MVKTTGLNGLTRGFLVDADAHVHVVVEEVTLGRSQPAPRAPKSSGTTRLSVPGSKVALTSVKHVATLLLVT